MALDLGDVSPFYGRINPFYGRINPFYGDINPSYGKISPFWGDITPFWGDVSPFYGRINPFDGALDPFWGTANPFTASGAFLGTAGTYWQSAGPQWGDINTRWESLQSANASDYSSLQAQLNGFFSSASNVWLSRMMKPVPGAKALPAGSDFMKAFVLPLMSTYGIDPNDPNSLAKATVQQRSAFFLDFYDSLMNYAGTDHVDWWMAAVHWSPMLAQIQGSANNAAVGILDAYTTPQFSDVNKLAFVGGYKNSVLDHGAAVASLIAAKQDGMGVMGVAPNATVQVLYNPFDATSTASWDDVATGIATLFAKNATVINASLGVPGAVLTSEWSEILNSPSLVSTKHALVLVKAAGNEGVMQTTNVPWTGTTAPTNLVLVGSVGPSGDISTFSNTPGEACITLGGVCNEQDKLKYRFIVAPGELLLVADNHGDVERVSGTSFAAPLVTGAIALLQDRWPWLQKYSDETVQIILQSATDLGPPGVDPVYGWGELNIEASQSPLNWDNLQVYQGNTGGKVTDINLDPSKPFGTAVTPASLKASVLLPGQLALWQNQGAYLVAFENIGATYRDFQIPLSSLLVGRKANIGKGANPFETYLYQRMIDWATGTASWAFNSRSMQVRDGGWKLAMTATQTTPDEQMRSTAPIHSDFVASNDDLGLSVRFGEGSASHVFSSSAGFSLRSDFDPATGGVNPILGLASGGSYAQVTLAPVKYLTLSFGATQKSDNHVYLDPTFGPTQIVPLAPNKASASTVGFKYDLVKGVSLNGSYTSLTEADGLLGAQGGGALDFGRGQTGAVTFGATETIDGWLFSQSATTARTRTAPTDFLLVTGGSLKSTAFALVASKSSLLAGGDIFRFSVTQPLHVEDGSLEYRSLEVVDRSNGALGTVSQTWKIGAPREYRIESSYGMMVLSGDANVEGFAMADFNGPLQQGGQATILTAGARFKWRF